MEPKVTEPKCVEVLASLYQQAVLGLSAVSHSYAKQEHLSLSTASIFHVFRHHTVVAGSSLNCAVCDSAERSLIFLPQS